MTVTLRTLLIGALCVACGSQAALTPTGEESRSVTQGGPQDIGEFRRVVDGGQVPAIDLLDEVGFFAEHALDLPAADCGDPLCVHPMLAVAPRFDGGNWTMAFIGANTAADPAAFAAKPRHLIVVVEHSPRTYEVLPEFYPLAKQLTAALDTTDRVSVLVLANGADWLLQGREPQALSALEFPSEALVAQWERQVEEADPGEVVARQSIVGRDRATIDLYSALVQVAEYSRLPELADYQQQVLLLSSGVVDTGTHELERFTGLGETLASDQIAISTIGIGLQYRREILSGLADVGSGNYYYAESGADLEDALAVESETRFVPLARNLEFELTAAAGYRVGRIYGARRSEVSTDSASLSSPVVFLGARSSATDVETGRRGGGGGWFVELTAQTAPGEEATETADAFTLDVRYDDPNTRESYTLDGTLQTPLGIGNNPMPDAPFFSNMAYAKPFMMLNMYLALRTALTLFEAGSCGEATGVQNMMTQSYDYWQQLYDDPDIDADFALLEQLTQVMQNACDQPSVPPAAPPMSCFMF